MGRLLSIGEDAGADDIRSVSRKSEFGMAELEPQSNTADPIASLHRMSTTAGVATSDYVAINSLSIVTLVLGAATVLAIAWMPLILIGLAGIVCGVMAIRQISQSNGTQAGKGLAMMGMLLSIVLAGSALGLSWAKEAALNPDRQAINQTVTRFGQLIAKRDYAGAYDLFDSEFKAGSEILRGMSLQEFEAMFKPLQEQDNDTGPLTEARGNDMFSFLVLPDGTQLASTNVIFLFEKNVADPRSIERVQFDFRKQPDGSWKILGIPRLLDQRQPRKPRQ
jgi:hypothetical protein